MHANTNQLEVTGCARQKQLFKNHRNIFVNFSNYHTLLKNMEDRRAVVFITAKKHYEKKRQERSIYLQKQQTKIKTVIRIFTRSEKNLFA